MDIVVKELLHKAIYVTFRVVCHSEEVANKALFREDVLDQIRGTRVHDYIP